MKKSTLFLACAFFVVCGLAQQGFSKESSCVACHTDDAALKSLFNPPEVHAEEGEG